MSQLTNLNTFPYFDDFTKDSNYYKVLFKPGQPVQARELTTLQSIVQDQIEKFGNHIFKDGSVVIPGSLTVRSQQYNIVLEDSFSGIDVRQYIDNLIGLQIRGSQSGVIATVEVVDESTATLFVDVINSGSSREFTEFILGESLILENGNISITDAQISFFGEGSEIGVIRSVGSGSIAKITDGVFFLRGYFVEVPEQVIIISVEEPQPTCLVGFSIVEELFDSYDDESLFDNSQGFVNFAAPGADRLRITAKLVSTFLEGGLKPETPQNFVELARVEYGRITSSKFENPQYNILADELARRTFDESGHYYVKPFSIDVRESLRDYKGNNGIYNSNDLTLFGEIPRDDLGVYDISSGKAYVFGYEVDMPSNTLLDFRKPRTTKNFTGQAISYVTGPTVSLTRAFGSPNIGLSTTYTISLRDERVGSAQTVAAGKEIGLARIYDYALESGSYESTNLDANVWDLSLFDIVPFTDIIVNENIESVKTPTFIEGKASGAVGFLRYDVTNSGIITAYNVRGNFIKGEELIFDGNDSDRITIASTTYSIANAKSIFGESGFSTFSADIRQKPIISLGPCKIDNSGVVTQAGRDFSKDFAINDLVQYRIPGGSNPTINKVSSVTSNSITLESVEDVSGVSLGSVSSAIDSIDIQKLTTNLLNTNTEDENFLFTQLPKKVVASVDTTDSEISFRRKFNTEIVFDSSGGKINILPSDLNPNETFLPFDAERYIVINKNGQTEQLTSDKFTITSGNRELIIRGLSTLGSAVLIASLKTPEAKPLQKIKNRIKSIVINKSKNPGSGIGATTLNDGLEYGNYPYGTRVQDKEICLLEADVIKLHAIYESSTSANAIIPRLRVTDINSFNESVEDALTGEEVFGSSSGCIAILTNIIDTDRFEYVSTNGKDFELGEQITFQESSIIANIESISQGDNNITNRYILSSGYKNTIYDYSKIIRNSTDIEPIKSLTIFYEYASIDPSDTGTLLTADSYYNFRYEDIGKTNGISHSDIIDIRPRVNSYTVSENARSPFEFLGRSFDGDQNKNLNILVSDESITIDYSIYLPRVDKIYLNKDKVFQLSLGIPSEVPQDPSPVEDAIEVARIFLPAFLFKTSDARLSLSSYKRYQMRDIAKLEDRIKNLEYYTSLSLLEQSTSNLEIKDSEGIDRFKSGFFVDNFTTTTNQIKVGAKNSIDPQNNELRPASYTTQLDLLLGSSQLTGVNGPKNSSADARYVTDLVGEDIRRSTVDPNGTSGSDGMGILTLDYEETELISQENATRIVNAAPYFVNFYKGTITLNPTSDIWIDQSRIETQTVEGLIGGYTEVDVNAKASDLDPQAGWSPILWGGWNEEWTGRTVTPSTLSDSDSKSEDGVDVSVTTTITSSTTTRTGTKTQSGLSRRVQTVPGNNINLGDKIIGSNVSSFLRSRNIEVLSRRLKPNTRLYTFFSGIDVTSYCTPKLIEIRMVSGSFQVGERIQTNSTSPGLSEDKPWISFRLSPPRHRSGPFNDPIDGYNLNPYTGERLPDNYSNTSTILNVDLASLALQPEGQYYGYISTGMVLVGTQSNARAIVNDVRLITDETGTLFASFYIPNSNAETSPKFRSGNNTLKLQDSRSLNPIEGSLSSAGESVFFSQGTIQQVQGTIISTRNVEVTNAYTTQSQTITDESTVVTGIDVSLGLSVTPQPIPRPEPRPQPRTPPIVPPRVPPRSPVTPRIPPRVQPQTPVTPRIPPRVQPRVQPRSPVTPRIPPRVQPRVPVEPRPRPRPQASPPPRDDTTRIPPRPRPARRDDGGRPTPRPVRPPTRPPVRPVGDNRPRPRPTRRDSRGDAGRRPPPRPQPQRPRPQPQRPRPRPTGDRPGDERPPRPALLPEPYDDPLAQSFFVGNETDKTGCFVTSASLYFQSTSETESCFVQLRPMVNGLPSSQAYPMSNVVVQGTDIEVSDDASIPTVVTFPSPIYLEGNKEHCIVIGSRSTAFNLWVSRLGEVDISNLSRPESEQVPVIKQSNLGSLFKSQNSYTWTPSQYEDLKYSINRAEFTDVGSISFFNPDLSKGNKQVASLKKDSLQGFSRSIIVGLGTTAVGYGTEIVPGNTVIQDNSNGTGNYVTGLGIATGNMTIVNAGIGLTPSSGFFQYDNVSLTKITGRGQNATANIHVSNGVAIAATIDSGGNGFKVGDILTGSLGIGVGRNLQLSISEIYGINEILLNQVQGEFEAGVGKTLRYINSSGITSEFSNNVSVTLDETPRIITDGLHIKVNHLNHGMHSPTNRVVINDVSSDIPFTRLSNSLSASEDNQLELDDASQFEVFEGIGIGTTNPGYLKIGNEVVGYTSISNNILSDLTRSIDSTFSAEYDIGEPVMKYESNGISLRRINKTHLLQDSTVEESIGLDHYNIRIDMNENGVDRSNSSSFSNLYLNDTKSFGGEKISASQNISYEIMKPIISTMTVQKTNITARARTVSSTSISGNEVSFIDQGYENISIDDDNYFDTPRLIASNENASNLLTSLPGEKSFEIELTLNSFDSRLSPVVDLDRVGAIFVSNRVNEVINDYVSDPRTASIKDDPSAFIYATKPIELEIAANNIKVITAAYINNFSDIRAFYAITNDPEEELIYYPFPGYNNLLESGQIINFNDNDGNSDSFVSPVNNTGFESTSLTYKDYEFTIENLPSFKFFSIKMVATSINQCYPPRLRDFRAVAFA